MSNALLIAIGLPIAYLVVSTAVLASRRSHRPRVLQRLISHNALLWNTLVGLTIAVAAIRWALSR
jgi:hypothetical protein